MLHGINRMLHCTLIHTLVLLFCLLKNAYGGGGVTTFLLLANRDPSLLFKSPTRVSQLTGTSPFWCTSFLYTLYPLLLGMDQIFHFSYTYALSTAFCLLPNRLSGEGLSAFLFLCLFDPNLGGCRVWCLPLFLTPQGQRECELGWGCMPRDRGVHPCMACLPACVNAGISHSPVYKYRSEMGRESVLAQQYQLSSYLCCLLSLFYPIALLPLFSRTACFLVSLFSSPFFSLPQTINIPFSLSTFPRARSYETIKLLVHSVASYVLLLTPLLSCHICTVCFSFYLCE
jgi:hypothetical protein